MSVWNKPRDAIDIRLGKRERKDRNGHTVAYDPDRRPGPIDGVDLDFRVREKRKELRYSGKVTWDALAPGTCEADIALYHIQLEATDKDGVPKDGVRRKFASVIINDPEDLEPDNLIVWFRDLDHPRSWYWRARVRVIDTAGRRGEWSDWTDHMLPHQDAKPLPPYPDNIVMEFDKNEKKRHEPRWRGIVKFDEIQFWDVPPTADVDAVNTTLRADFNIGDTTARLTSVSGWAVPLPKEPLAATLRPHNEDEYEIIRYSGVDVPNNNLTGVRRAQEGTTEHNHPNGAAIKSSAADQQERHNDLQAYIVQIRRWDTATADFMLTDEGKYIQRTKSHSWKSEEDDADSKVRAVFPNLTKKQSWKCRARTRDRFNRLGDWSPWSTVFSVVDETDPPQPNNVEVAVDNHKVHVDWEFEPDPDDATSQHDDIAYYQVELHKNESFTDLVKKDYFVVGTKKTFRVKKASIQYWARVRSVDGSENKSEWATNTANKQRPGQGAEITNITFDDAEKEKGAKLRCVVVFTYDEAGYNEDHIDRYVVEAIITSGAAYTGNEPRKRVVVEAQGDDAETDANDPKSAVFKGVPRHKWIRCRFRAIDKDNRKGVWSPWSASFQITDTTAPPDPVSVSVESDVKGALVKWENPNDPNDLTVVDNDIHYSQVELHVSGSTPDNPIGLLARDREVKSNRKRFKGIGEGTNLVAWVRNVGATKTKSGWVSSTGVITAPIVDRPAIVPNAVGPNEVDETQEYVGTWENSNGASRVVISSGQLDKLQMFISGKTFPGGLRAGGDTIILEAPTSGTTPFIYLDASLGWFWFGTDEIMKDNPQRGYCSMNIPNNQASANDKWGYGVTYGGATLAAGVPTSVAFTRVGNDTNVRSGSVGAEDISARGFRFVATVDVTGTVMELSRLYSAS